MFDYYRFSKEIFEYENVSDLCSLLHKWNSLRIRLHILERDELLCLRDVICVQLSNLDNFLMPITVSKICSSEEIQASEVDEDYFRRSCIQADIRGYLSPPFKFEDDLERDLRFLGPESKVIKTRNFLQHMMRLVDILIGAVFSGVQFPLTNENDF